MILPLPQGYKGPRASFCSMAYTFARVSAVLKLKRGDYALHDKRARLRLLEKGNKEKLV